ncbi:MAG TPA: hypothetical protein VHE61_09315 [Opitutaceae bacterium]|nr:hypothetical protein [Opitutaceae bacterium]
MKSVLAVLLAATCVPALCLATPLDDIKAAAKKLADAPTYGWTATTENAGGGGFGAGTATGVTEKDGYTVLTREFNGNTFQSARKGDKVVLQNRDGDWVTREDMMQQFGATGASPRSGFFGVPTPAEQVVDLATGAKDLKVADGAITGDLAEKSAAELLRFGRNAPKSATASVKIWLKDGALAKYELHLKGTITGRDGEDREVDRTTTTEVKDVGSAKVQVPEEAKKLLGS